MDEISQIRQFNRTLTRHIGVLETSFLGRDRSIGASRVYLLKLIVGYESKKCSSIPRMQLENHTSMKLYNL